MSEKNNTLLLHIGTAKTGTTAIQEFLRLNQDKLQEQGWYYPDLYSDYYGEPEKLEKTTGAHMPNGMVLYYMTGAKHRLYRGAVWKHIYRYLRDYNTIVSCESMFDNLDGITLYERLAGYKKKYGNIKVVVYLRRQDLWIESAWNQAVEGNYFWDDIRSFIKSYPRGSQSPDYLMKIREIERAVGKENLIIRIYEKGQFAGDRADAISDFAEVLNGLGCGIGMKDAVIPERLNPRLTDEALSYALIFSAEYHKYADDSNEYVQELYKLVNDITLENGGIIGGYLTKEERIGILARYRDGNETLAREYLFRNDGRLFHDTNMDIPMWEKKDFNEVEEAHIRMYAAQMGKLGKLLSETSQKAFIENRIDTFSRLLKSFI